MQPGRRVHRASAVKRLRHVCLLLLVGLSLPLPAQELTDYHAGDSAAADIATPMALDVPDAVATAQLQSTKATEFPAVFRGLPETSNLVTRDFLIAFEQARTNFLAELAGAFQAAPVAETVIASADFGRLVTACGVKNKNFPVTDELAAAWARGDSGQAIQEKLLAALQRAAGGRILPEALPKGIVIGATIRLVSVTNLEQKLSVAVVEHSPLVPSTGMLTLADAQIKFRREFPAGQELLARALADLLQPNCFFDAPFTQLTRGTAVCQLTVADHFDAGDVIVHRGEQIDAKMLAALALLNEKMKSIAAAVTPVIVANPPAPASASPPPRVRIAVAPVAATPPAIVSVKAANRHTHLILVLAAISVSALMVAGWQFQRHRQLDAPASPTLQVQLPLPEASRLEISPQVAQVVQDAVLQELATQRRNLLLTQAAATEEVTALVQRLDELQLPLQKRLHSYETRIQALEQELSERSEANRELVQMKIEVIRLRLESERTTTTATGPNPPAAISANPDGPAG